MGRTTIMPSLPKPGGGNGLLINSLTRWSRNSGCPPIRFPGESGRTGGAVVSVLTKSGSNKFHGTGFYYLRDSVFDTANPALNIKPSSTQHQFGFTVGGPLRRNRAFFFAGYDQHIFHEPTVVRLVNGGTVVVPQLGPGPALQATMNPLIKRRSLRPPPNCRNNHDSTPQR